MAPTELAPTELAPEDLSQEVSCSGRRFSTSVDVSTVTVDPVLITARQGESVDTATVENRSILAFDLPLETLMESNKTGYLVSGHCASSVGSVELAIEGMNSDVPCVSDQFLGFIDASHVRTKSATITLTQGPAHLEAMLSNELFVRVAFDPPLGPIQEGNKATYPVGGVCDSSESDLVVLTIGEGVSQYLSCSDNRFLESIDMSAVTLDPVSITLSQEMISHRLRVNNEILVGVSVSDSLPSFTELNKTNYLVSGVCDSSESSTVELTIAGLSQNLPCVGNRFLRAIDVSAVTVDPATLTVSQGLNSNAVMVANEILVGVRLSSLPIVTDANKGSYLVSGICDSSESGVVRVTVGEVGALPVGALPIINQDLTCSGNRFSESLDVSGVTADLVAFTVTQGTNSDSATVANEIDLSFTLPIAVLTEENKTSYSLSGRCNSLLRLNVTLMVGGVSQDVNCSGSRFSESLDVSGVTEDPVTIRATQGVNSVTATVANEILVGVSFSSLPMVTEVNKGSYLVSGVCDSSESGLVTVTAGEDSASPVSSQEATCTNNQFSGSLDVSGVTADPATIRVTQGTNSDSATVANEILVGVTINISLLEAFTEANKLAYPLSGVCDSSESGLVTVTVGEDSTSLEISQDITCSGNRFSESLDVSGVTAESVLVTVTQGANSVTATVANEILVGVAINNDLLEALTDANKLAYLVSGVCDSSESGLVTVDMGTEFSAELSQDVTCSGNRFSGSLNASRVSASLVFIKVTQGVSSDTEVVHNTISLLINTSLLEALTEANKLTYLVSGLCDSSDSSVVTVTAGEEGASPVVSQEATCTNNQFSVSLDVSGVTADPATIKVVQGIHSDPVTAANEILVGVVLASSLPTIIDDANKEAYPVSGICDSSEPGVVTVTVGEVGASSVNQDVTCSGNRFSEFLDVSGVTAESVLVTVTQGANSDTVTVANEIRLAFTLPMAVLTEDNKASYSVSGKCESSAGTLTLTVETLSHDLACSSDSFSEAIDVSHATADPVTMTLTQGGRSARATVSNELSIAVALNALADLDAFNKEAYLVSGICDSSESGLVTVTMGEADISPLVSQDLTCLGNRFSEAINIGAVNFDPIVVTATQGSNSDRVNIGNNGDDRLLLTRPLEAFTDSNKLVYPVSGICESSIGETLTLTVGEEFRQQLTCSNNAFSEAIDISEVRANPARLVVIQGQRMDTESVDNQMNLAPLPACVHGGSGNSAADPKVICTYSELSAIREDVNGDSVLSNRHYALGADIEARSSWSEGATDCEAYNPDDGIAATNPCSGWVPLPKLKGESSFDGRGHEIRDLYINSSLQNVGLFSTAGNGFGTIHILMKNLHMRRGWVKTDYSRTSNVGLLVGLSDGSYTCDNCSATGEIEGEGSVGGLIGSVLNDDVKLFNSYADVRVQGRLVGTLVGYHGGRAYNSHGRGTVTGKSWPGSTYSFAGGLIGSLFDGSMANSYSGAEVTGDYGVGSVVGSGEDSSIYKSYGIGSVSGGLNIGGFGGDAYGSASGEDNFWNIETTGQSQPFSSEANISVTGLTTTQMQSSCLDTHAGDDICALGSAFVFRQGSYPLLKKCSNCDSDSPTYLEELVGGQLD